MQIGSTPLIESKYHLRALLENSRRRDGMKLEVIVISVALILCTSWPAALADQLLGNKPVTPVIVESPADCGYWLSSRQNKTSIGLEDFAIGMLDGLAKGADKEYWKADGRMISRDAAYFSIDRYCREHPTNPLITAISSVFRQRVERNGTTNR